VALFNQENTFKDIFDWYKYRVCEDGNFCLFASEDDCLDDEDYNTLFRKIVYVAQMYNPHINNFDRATSILSPDERRYFYRCFGIYLREAALRYAEGVTGNAGRFWDPLENGVRSDFIRNRFGDKTWFWGNTRLRDALHGGLFQRIFSYFKDPELKCNNGRMADHLMKLAVLPWNNNPLRKHLNNLIDAYEQNNVHAYVNDLDRQGLNRSKKTKSHLIYKIQDFLEFAENCVRQNVDLETAKLKLRENFSYVKTNHHYFYEWLTTICDEKETKERVRCIRHDVKNNTDRESIARDAAVDAQIYSAIVHGEFCNKLPSRVYVADLFGSYFDDIRNNDLVEIFEGEDADEALFQIQNRHLSPVNEAGQNSSVMKLLSLKEIVVEFDDDRQRVDNPWYKGENAFLFDELGRETLSWDGRKLYIVSSERVRYITDSRGNDIEFTQNDQDWINVYSIQPHENIDSVDFFWIEFEDGSFEKVNVEDPNAVHILSEFDGKSPFIQQKPSQKIGIGSVEFSHLSGVDQETIKSKASVAYANLPVTVGIDNEGDLPHLVLENSSDRVLELPRCELGEKYIPAVTLLPNGVYVWVADGENGSVGYIKGNVQGLPQNWIQEGGLYKISNVTDPVSFSEAGPQYSLLKSNYNGRRFGGNLNSYILMHDNAPFNVAPDGAKYLFKWTENGCTYKVCVPMDKPVRECYEKLGINGAEVEFGWEFEGTCYTKHFSEEPDYEPNERDEDFYDMTLADRQEYLTCCVTGAPFVSQANRLFEKFPVINPLPKGAMHTLWYLHGVDRIRSAKDLPISIRRAFDSGWLNERGEDYARIYPICLLNADITQEKALQIGRAFVYWKDNFSNALIVCLDERLDPNNKADAKIADTVEKHMIFSMEGVDLLNITDLHANGRDDEIDEMIRESVNRFIPELIRYLGRSVN